MTITPEEVAKLMRAPLTQIEQLRLHIENDLSPPCLNSLLDEIDTLEAAAHDMAALIAEQYRLLKLADALAYEVTDSEQSWMGLSVGTTDALAAYSAARETLK